MKKIEHLLIIIILLSFSCKSTTKEKEILHPEGKVLAEKYCQSCHLLPDPKELPQSIWKNDVLPKMGARLGMLTGKIGETDLLKSLNLFPEQPLLNRTEWLEILNYYIENAPLFDQSYFKENSLQVDLPLFKVRGENFTQKAPFTTLLHWDTTGKRLFYGNDATNDLTTWVIGKTTKESQNLSGAPVQLLKGKDGFWVLTMGKVMPHNQKSGALSFIPVSTNGDFKKSQILLSELQRPVHASIDDLDADGNLDIVISCFGNYAGELIWFSNFESKDRQKIVLRALPGAVKTVIYDFNKDGLPDILALMAQGDEGILLYENKGNGEFAESYLLRFPATYGSTYFELLDYNQDGLQDILYVNGDNGDYYPIRKAYHGIRLFLNEGENLFEEAFFLPHHGAFKAKIVDFDLDNDLDIAAISYFPDYKNRAEEGFVFYENNGQDEFVAKTISNSSKGKWLTMETGDMDADGDVDIFLGSALYMQVEVPAAMKQQRQKEGTAIMILENKTK